MGEAEPPAIRREGERPARMESVRRLDGARFVKALLKLKLGQRLEAEARSHQVARPYGVVGTTDNELRLGRRAGRKRRLEGETCRGIERPDFAFIVEFAPAPALATGRLYKRALADEACA